MNNTNFVFETVNPHDMSEDFFREIAKVEKEMWAYGIWEYVKCKNCNLIHSKNDVFWHLANDIRNESVTKLESIIAWDSIKCNNCNSDTEFIYNEDKYILDIKERLLNSNHSFLSISRHPDSWELLWFMDWYIDVFKKVYDRELSQYYNIDVLDIIKNRIEKKLSEKIQNEILSFSSMWTLEKYRSFYIVFELIRNFFNIVPDDFNNIMWITELDTWSNLHWFHHSMWIINIELINDEELNKYRINRSNDFDSDLYVQPNVVKKYKETYNLWVRQFIKKFRNTMKEIIVA